MPHLVYTSASEAFAPIARITAPGKAEYAARHGYDFLNVKLPDDCRMRMAMLMPVLKERDEWMLFLGADALITNHTRRIEEFVSDDADFIVGEDVHGLNNDVFFLRCGQIGVGFIDRISRLMSDTSMNDQDAMKAHLGTLRTKMIHQRQFNAYLYSEYSIPDIVRGKSGTWQRGDFVLHTPGLPLSRRVEIMREYVGWVIR